MAVPQRARITTVAIATAMQSGITKSAIQDETLRYGAIGIARNTLRATAPEGREVPQMPDQHRRLGEDMIAQKVNF